MGVSAFLAVRVGRAAAVAGLTAWTCVAWAHAPAPAVTPAASPAIVRGTPTAEDGVAQFRIIVEGASWYSDITGIKAHGLYDISIYTDLNPDEHNRIAAIEMCTAAAVSGNDSVWVGDVAGNVLVSRHGAGQPCAWRR
jgi:hypothetical protein